MAIFGALHQSHKHYRPDYKSTGVILSGAKDPIVLDFAGASFYVARPAPACQHLKLLPEPLPAYYHFAVPYTVGCSPAPLTFTIRPRFDWQFLLSIGWLSYFGYQLILTIQRKQMPKDVVGIFLFISISFAALLSLIRRERIEIYSDQMIWRRTYFGITSSKAAPLGDILGAEWSEGDEHDRRSKGTAHVEFYLAAGTVEACFGITFEEFDHMRDDIRAMYPDLVKRWGQSSVRSKDFTLLNLS